MRLYTPDSLLYPIKITQLLRSPGEEIARNDPLFAYEYKSRVHESSAENPEGYEVERTWPARFESELEGTLDGLHVSVGQILTRRTQVADIEEPCRHEVQFGGMCAICGKDLTVSSSYNSTMKDTERATVNTVHGHTTLLVSHSEASKADEEAKRRLLDSRKLSLVVDLDQTIIHATVDPTVAEWQQDLSNPNHEAVKDVRAFQLMDDSPGARGCWYYIKLRPGLADFLDRVSKIYELHIYTMGTRAYAENIAKIIDPERKIFGDRILSRDESGSMTAKNLRRLFPVDTKMVVIIDDRGDVWQWSPNLIKVSAYDFFVGIGDINSSFLPKRHEIEAKPAQTTNGEHAAEDNDSNGAPNAEQRTSAGELKSSTGDAATTNGGVSAVDHLLSMAGKQDAESMKEKTEEQDSAIATQLAERPLLQKQKILDAVEDEAKTSPAVEAATSLLAEDGDTTVQDAVTDHPRYRHNLLQDDDTELRHIGHSLSEVHKAFFTAYNSNKSATSRQTQNLDSIPDAARIMADMKAGALAGVHLVFSGVVPLGVDIHAHDTVIWAQSFGASVSENITKKTTHIVASPERRTAKVRQAAKQGGRIRIVSVGWLMACFSQWRRVDDRPFRIHCDAESKSGLEGGLPDSFGEDQAALSGSEEGDATTEDEIEDSDSKNKAQPNITAVTTELAKFGPSMLREDSSPTETEHADTWGDIDAELAEFLGSDVDDESDAESTISELDGASKGKSAQRKRKRINEAEESETEAQTDAAGSRLQKRKREALARTTSLTNVAAASDGASPTRRVEDAGSAAGEEEEEEENDDLEAALAAEMLREEDDDEKEGG